MLRVQDEGPATGRSFFVQSGSIRMRVEAGDCHKAALWAVHQALEPSLPLEAAGGARPVYHGRLGRHIRVMRADGMVADSFDTYAILLEWSQLLAALDRVESAMKPREPREDDLPPLSAGVAW